MKNNVKKSKIKELLVHDTINFIAFFFCLCLLSGCTSSELSDGDLPMKNNRPSVDIDSAQQIENNLPSDDISNTYSSELKEKVVMTVLADTAGNIDITVTNNSNGDIDMGKDFSLQKKVGKKWKDVSLALNYSDDLIVISPNESHTFHYNIGKTLKDNIQYRIVKNVSDGKINHSIFMSFEVH